MRCGDCCVGWCSDVRRWLSVRNLVWQSRSASQTFVADSFRCCLTAVLWHLPIYRCVSTGVFVNVIVTPDNLQVCFYRCVCECDWIQCSTVFDVVTMREWLQFPFPPIPMESFPSHSHSQSSTSFPFPFSPTSIFSCPPVSIPLPAIILFRILEHQAMCI